MANMKDMSTINEVRKEIKEEQFKEDEFKSFMKHLKDAGEKIEFHYFQIPIANSDKLIFRERVYCYELYHQIRSIAGEFYYKLDGELDKAGNPSISKKLRKNKPDFIVHEPGKKKRNLVIIEVKPLTVKNKIAKLKEDIKTLKEFVKKEEYYRGIMLIYGDGKTKFPQKIVDNVKSLIKGYENRIILVWHYGPKTRPEEIQLVD